MGRPGWLAAALLLAAVSCSNNSTKRDTPRLRSATCQDVRAHVESLYRAYHQERAAGSTGQSGDQAAMADDIDMVLADCQSAPTRLVPCLQAATSAPELERDCLIPLDDEGTVEGRAFRPQ